MIRVAILTISDKGASGERQDESGRLISEMIEEISGKEEYYKIIPDEYETIKKELIEICENQEVDLVLTTGGTGLAKRDVTPEATTAVVKKEVPGITEKMRGETGKITPKAYLSRAKSGIYDSTLIVNLPGSKKAVRECLESIFDILPHGIEILKGKVTEHE